MRAAALVLLALLVSGCSSPPPRPPPLVFTGLDCTEVGAALAVDGTALRARLPAGFAPRPAAGAVPGAQGALLVLAVNYCAFEAGAARASQPEAFLWAPVDPPANATLAPGAMHFVELVDWRPPGALLDALRAAARPAAQPAAFEGADSFAAGQALAITVRPEAGGSLGITGTAAAPATITDHPAGPCCRIVARGPQGLVAFDLTSTDQPFGEAPCTVRAEVPAFADLLPALQETRCGTNGAYRFLATAHALG